MATSLKLSELQELSSLTSDDLFLVTDLGSSSSRKVTYATLTSDLVSQIGTSQATLQASIDAVQADVDSNESAANAAIAAEASARAVAVSSETTSREQAVAALQTLINSLQTESTSRLARIESLETSIDNLDIDIAPETLNSIQELSTALGDDPQIITNLQSQLTDYIAHIEARNLEASLAEGYLYADTFYGG